MASFDSVQHREKLSLIEKSFESDIWSLGVLLYEMSALQPPFIAQNQL